MGIQRLLQDLFPYAESVVLGGIPKTSQESKVIKNLIVDGPSLVYFVHKRLSQSSFYREVQPTYATLGEAVRRILETFESHGAYIRNIFFDGGLPKSKRETRLARMEKVRQQLDIFRQAHRAFPSAPLSYAETIDVDKALWTMSPVSTRIATLPAPPFMVAGVIESLRTRNSVWRDRVQTVPGEADIYCALAAHDSTETIAILTDDSDLAVHDLGPNGRVALLHSLEMVPQMSSADGRPSLVALSINPTLVATRLNVSSLAAFAFERSRDATVSTAMIRERATVTNRSEQLELEYTTFLEEFTPSPALSSNGPFYLEGIDPRIAELLVAFKGAPLVYMTPVLEDPQRDSSWLYGAHIRRLSYSILLSSTTSRREESLDRSTAISEYARRGQRIAPTTVPSFTRAGIIAQAAELEDLLATYVNESTDFTAWHALAIHVVLKEKFSLQQTTPSLRQVFRLFGLLATEIGPDKGLEAVPWDDVHLLANIHAVLYSLRMLHQITGSLLKGLRRSQGFAAEFELDVDVDENTSEITKKLHTALSTMHPIADLFFDPSHLRHKMSQLSSEGRGSAMRLLEAAFRQVKDSTSPSDSLAVDQAEHRNADTGNQNGENILAKPKKSRKRERHSVEVVKAVRSNNMFGLLEERNG